MMKKKLYIILISIVFNQLFCFQISQKNKSKVSACEVKSNQLAPINHTPNLKDVAFNQSCDPVSAITNEGNIPGDQGAVSIRVQPKASQKMKIALIIEQNDTFLDEVIPSLVKNLDGFGQQRTGFDITISHNEVVHHKKDIEKWFKQGYQLIIFVSGQHDELIWRVYDASQATMLAGKKAKIAQLSKEQITDYLANELWTLLTGQESIFHTKIAFCKQYKHKNTILRDIYATNPCAYKPQLLVKGGKPLAPRWNKNEVNPLLLYSEITPKNIRLMSADMNGNRRIVSNWDGMNGWTSFASDGKAVVFCLSKSGNSQLYCHEYDELTHKINVTQVTHNSGNNISPTLRDNGDIIFCSDFETKYPQIYYYHADTKVFERIATDGYCASPSFCEKNHMIAYCKPINGVMQIFTYNIDTQEHKQLTFNEGSKDESCWSPQGQYLAYSVDLNSKSRIALFNMVTQESLYLTPETEYCVYPTWSSGHVMVSENINV